LKEKEKTAEKGDEKAEKQILATSRKERREEKQRIKLMGREKEEKAVERDEEKAEKKTDEKVKKIKLMRRQRRRLMRRRGES
jgi:hypothetical protein